MGIFHFDLGYYWIACYVSRKISAVETPGAFSFLTLLKQYLFVWWGTVIEATFHSINQQICRNAVSETHLAQGLSLQYLTKHLRLTIVLLIIKLELQRETT